MFFVRSNYSDLTSPPNVGLARNSLISEKNLGWWNIIIWPYIYIYLYHIYICIVSVRVVHSHLGNPTKEVLQSRSLKDEEPKSLPWERKRWDDTILKDHVMRLKKWCTRICLNYCIFVCTHLFVCDFMCPYVVCEGSESLILNMFSEIHSLHWAKLTVNGWWWSFTTTAFSSYFKPIRTQSRLGSDLYMNTSQSNTIASLFPSVLPFRNIFFGKYHLSFLEHIIFLLWYTMISDIIRDINKNMTHVIQI